MWNIIYEILKIFFTAIGELVVGCIPPLWAFRDELSSSQGMQIIGLIATVPATIAALAKKVLSR